MYKRVSTQHKVYAIEWEMNLRESVLTLVLISKVRISDNKLKKMKTHNCKQYTPKSSMCMICTSRSGIESSSSQTQINKRRHRKVTQWCYCNITISMPHIVHIMQHCLEEDSHRMTLTPISYIWIKKTHATYRKM